MKQQFLRMKSSDGIELPGILFEPENKTNEVVIHVHGLSGNFYENHFIDILSKTYTDHNIAFVTFNNRGKDYITEMTKNGESIICGSCYESFNECIFDIDGVVKYFEKLGYDKIILEGHSYGCNKVIHYLTKKEKRNIKKVVLLAPCDIPKLVQVYCNEKYEKIVKQAYDLQTQNKEMELVDFPPFANNKISAKTLLNDFLENKITDIFSYRNSKPSETLNKIHISCDVIYGTNDDCVLTEQEEKIDKFLIENIKKCNIYKIKNADHNFLPNIERLDSIIKKIIGD